MSSSNRGDISTDYHSSSPTGTRTPADFQAGTASSTGQPSLWAKLVQPLRDQADAITNASNSLKEFSDAFEAKEESYERFVWCAETDLANVPREYEKCQHDYKEKQAASTAAEVKFRQSLAQLRADSDISTVLRKAKRRGVTNAKALYATATNDSQQPQSHSRT